MVAAASNSKEHVESAAGGGKINSQGEECTHRAGGCNADDDGGDKELHY